MLNIDITKKNRLIEITKQTQNKHKKKKQIHNIHK